MSSVALSSTLGNLSNAAPAAPTAKTASGQTNSTATAVKAGGSLKQDTVKLSVAAQVKLMHHQGQSPALIAATLGTNVATVDGYLGVKIATQTAATPAASQTPSQATSTSEPAATTERASPEVTVSSSATAEPTATKAATVKS